MEGTGKQKYKQFDREFKMCTLSWLHFFHMVPTVPFVEEVTVTQNHTEIYNANWETEGNNRTSTPLTQSERNTISATGMSDLEVTIRFNESVRDVVIAIGGTTLTPSQGNDADTYPVFFWGEARNAGLDETGCIWTGYLNKNAITNGKLDGDKNIQITAVSFSDNNNNLDANPGTVAIWDGSSLQFNNYENLFVDPTDEHSGGPDTIHHLLFDNTRPYVKSVSITDETNYKGYWKPAGDKFIWDNPIDSPLSSGTYTVNVEFSEPVVNPTLNIDTFSDAITLSSTEPENNQKTFTGTINIPSGDFSHEGTRTMTIAAKDLAGNQLLKIEPDKTTILLKEITRDASGQLPANGGSDTSNYKNYFLATGITVV